ncbi:MAG: asparaginase [Actinomycetota bacterium]
MSPPLIVEVTRGGVVESHHEVDVAIVGADGHRSGFGRPQRPTLARSSMKPIQAFPLVATGAADAFDLQQEHLALACASHNGEPRHVEVVTEWLGRLGHDHTTLECGAHMPLHGDAEDVMIRSGVAPDARHNNCSGKHTGFLTVCRHLGVDPAGYLRPDHPVQEHHITKATEAACGIDLSDQTPVVDGCGIPIWGMPLENLAQGWATLATTDEGRRLFAAMQAEPFMVAGTGRMCTRIMEASEGIAVKTGAEGVFSGVHVESGLAWSLKARDGATRASEAAVLWLMRDLGFRVDVDDQVIRNHAGLELGVVRVAS